jgi:hypothetical protein
MKNMKLKTYALTVSRRFPVKHPKAGHLTMFVEQIRRGTCKMPNECDCCENVKYDCSTLSKLHTIRANYELWKKRFDEVNEGKAVLSLRYWTGKPYNSKQQEFLQLTKDDGIGVQKIDFSYDYLYNVLIDGKIVTLSSAEIPTHDGLSHQDFESWFKGYDLSKPMAIIHFTKFRY